MLCMTGRNVQVQRRDHDRRRLPHDYDRLRVQQRRWRAVADLDPAIHARLDLARNDYAHIDIRSLRQGDALNKQQGR